MVLTLTAGPLTGIASASNGFWGEKGYSPIPTYGAEVTDIEVSPSGDYIAITDGTQYGDDGVVIYNADTGSQVAQKDLEFANDLTWHPSGNYIGAVGGNYLKIWSFSGSSLTEEYSISSGYDDNAGIAMSSDKYVYEDGVGNIEVFETGTAGSWGTRITNIAHGDETAGLGIAGDYVINGDRTNGEYVIYDSTDSYNVETTIDATDTFREIGIDYAPGTDRIAIIDGQRIEVYSTSDFSTKVVDAYIGESLTDVSIRDDGKYTAGVGYSGTVEVFEVSSDTVVKSDNLGQSNTLGSISMTSNDGVLAYSQETTDITVRDAGPTPRVESINLELADNTLVKPETANYAVNGSYTDGSFSYITDSSNVSSDDTGIVSIDSVNTEVEYQGDGTTIVRSNYTNATGVTLWSNKTVETDTPEISLNVETNSMILGDTKNYTVTRTIFGSTSDITGVANTSSDNVSVISVNESTFTYYGESIGTDNLTANNTYNGLTYEDSVEVEVTEPQKIIWDNWDYLNSGERMSLILSDWTIIYLFASLILSTGLAVRFKAGKIGLASMGGLTLMGWILGFVPDYTALTLLIFFTFIGFVFEWRVWVSRG
jgi:hypothetical protein